MNKFIDDDLDRQDELIDLAKEPMDELIDRLEAAGFSPKELADSLIFHGVCIQTAGLCGEHLVEYFESVRDWIDARIEDVKRERLN